MYTMFKGQRVMKSVRERGSGVSGTWLCYCRLDLFTVKNKQTIIIAMQCLRIFTTLHLSLSYEHFSMSI